jgi:hypothetical protein
MADFLNNAQSKNRNEDRRNSPRKPFDCVVRWDTGGVERYGQSKDVSMYGAGFTVRSLSAPQIGQRVRVVLQLADDYDWLLDDAAIVQRCDSVGEDLCEVGIRLTLDTAGTA